MKSAEAKKDEIVFIQLGGNTPELPAVSFSKSGSSKSITLNNNACALLGLDGVTDPTNGIVIQFAQHGDLVRVFIATVYPAHPGFIRMARNGRKLKGTNAAVYDATQEYFDWEGFQEWNPLEKTGYKGFTWDFRVKEGEDEDFAATPYGDLVVLERDGITYYELHATEYTPF